MTISQIIAKFVVETRYDDLPSEAVDASRRTLLDTLGVALAGCGEHASKAIMQLIEAAASRPSCTLLGSSVRACSTDAALANGVFAHVLDYDDVGHRAQGHLSAVLFPAILALAEEESCSGAEVVVAYVIGVEVWARIAATMPLLHNKGWHPTAVFGTLGAGMAAAKLLKLDAERAANALGIAASMAAGLTRNFGTDTKSLHVGNAARSGILAAQLARNGFTAAMDVFEGRLGFPAAFFHGQAVDASAMAAQLGHPFALVDPGVNVKKYPCCLLTQRIVDATIHLSKQYGLNAKDITEIVCEVPPLGPKILFYTEPANSLEAKFSLQHCVAAALIDRRLGLAQFTDEKVRDPAVRELGAKVKMRVYPDAAETETGDTRPDTIQIRCTDGRVLNHSVLRAKGHAEAPLDWGELVEKFRDAAGQSLDDRAALSTIDLVSRIETLPDIQPLMRVLSAPRSGASTNESAHMKVSFDSRILDLQSSPDGQARLLGSHCKECGAHFFPRQALCSACLKEDTLVDHFLSRNGRLYAYTIVERESIAPKGFDVPYVYGYVDLPEGVRVVAKIVDWDRETLQIDMPVEMVEEALRTDSSGAQVMAFRFRPVVPRDSGVRGGEA